MGLSQGQERYTRWFTLANVEWSLSVRDKVKAWSPQFFEQPSYNQETCAEIGGQAPARTTARVGTRAKPLAH